MIELSGVNKEYRMGTNVLRVLDSINLKIETGDFVAIMGPSGSGKSTLMHILGLLDVPSGGSYKLNSREVSAKTETELAKLRRSEFGFIFQQFNLLPRMTAFENVALPLLYSEKREIPERVQNLLDQVGLSDRVEHSPAELSGGQQQRVAIARALMNKPRILLADEPTGNLDSVSQKEIMAILKKLNEAGITVIVVTHEEEIGAGAKRRIRLRDGRVVSDERLQPLRVPMAAPPQKTEAPDSGTVDAHDMGKEGRGGLAAFYRYLVLGLRTLGVNKIRTGLSMLGILIGVAAVVAMLAVGRGAQNVIEKQLSALGSNLLLLHPGVVHNGAVALADGTVTRITLEDVAALKELKGVKRVNPTVRGGIHLQYADTNGETSLWGVDTTYPDMRAAQPEIGRFFTEEENQKRARVAVIGYTIVKDLFKGRNPIGEMIKINRINFQVIGILPAKGSAGWNDRDDIVVVPVLTAMHRLLGRQFIDTVDVEVESAAEMESVTKDLQEKMGLRHHVPPSQTGDAYEVNNLADVQAALAESGKTMTTLLASIAAISLLVGGIGIMNIMLVSVKERTREIGLRKAVGAAAGDILSQFLAEALVVSVVGGTFGILLGWGVSKGMAVFAGWPTFVSPSSVALAFFFSVGIGIVFGAYPAKTAAELHPIDALRYE